MEEREFKWKHSIFRNGDFGKIEIDVGNRRFFLTLGYKTWFLYSLNIESIPATTTYFSRGDVVWEHIFDNDLEGPDAFTMAKVLSQKLIINYEKSWEESYSKRLEKGRKA